MRSIITAVALFLASPQVFALSYTCTQHADPDQTWVYTLTCNTAKAAKVTVMGFQTNAVYVGECDGNNDGSIEFTAQLQNPNSTGLDGTPSINLGKIVELKGKKKFVFQGLISNLIDATSADCE